MISRALAVATVAAMSLAACSSGGTDVLEPLRTTSTSSTTSSTPTTTTNANDPLLINSLEAARSGVVRIVTQGDLRTPDEGFRPTSGSGSGFFVTSGGLLVTSAHLVNGTSRLDVYADGVDTAPWPARLIGLSECDDLALLQVDVPAPVAYFAWFDGAVDAGLDVYAAGFPLGDPEFTLTRGIVAKARADGDLTGTSSLPFTVEHDANLQPGSSGGPLITGDAQVVAVNQAGGARATTTAQFYAIPAELASDIVSRLSSGSVYSVGINAVSIYVDTAGIAGIWVSGVAPDSPAARLGVKPGDIIMTMDGVELGVAGNLSTYCRVLRAAAGGVVEVEVLRLDTSELLRGELNGDGVLQVVFSFADEIDTDLDPGDDRYERFLRLADSTGLLSADIPEAWDDISDEPLPGADGRPYPALVASSDRSGFPSTYAAPGVMFRAVPTDATTPDQWLDNEAPPTGDCSDGGRFDYDDGVFTGRYQVWSTCQGANATRVVLVIRASGPNASASDLGWTVITTVQALTTADLDALDLIWATFDLIG